MNWITEHIALGDWYDTLDSTALQAAGIEAVLQIHDPGARPDGFPWARAFLQLAHRDGEAIPGELLARGVGFIREQREAGRKVLVACSAGRSRSATFLTAYLHEEGLELLEAVLTVMRERRSVLPHPELLRSLIRYYDLPIDPNDLIVQMVRARKEMRWTG